MMPDFKILGILSVIGVIGIALFPYLFISLFVGGDSLWSIIPGGLWISLFVFGPLFIYLKVK